MSKRRYLTGKEVQAMMQAVCYGATGARDYCLILLAYRHGMRISELLDLHYQDLDLNEGRINIRRLKNGFSTVHPLRFDEREAVEPLDPGNVLTGKALTGLTLYLFLAAGVGFLASRPIALFAMPVLKLEP